MARSGDRAIARDLVIGKPKPSNAIADIAVIRKSKACR
jgi:hypothetical protein